ncbi:MAG: 3D domain-containing protein [Candidatus Magasanikbacteria bacterium]|nr:3D domain-containing protein [Candidatus Magasanikbacteria bacterium]
MQIKIKNTRYTRLFRISMSLVVGISLILSSLFPQVADAEGFSLSIFSQIFGNTEEVQATSVSFPVVEDMEPRRVITAVITAYSSDVAQTDSTPCIPADSTYDLCQNYAKTGAQDTIATNFLPLGTKVKFPELYGDKIFTVRDRMNARYGYGRGDIWMPTRLEAKNFGVKRVKMEIYYR